MKSDITNHIAFKILPICIAFLAFAFASFPWLNPFNVNREQKALYGHIDSQLYLGDHYFVIGDYSKSIYWYDLAATRENWKGAIALNNLGYIYSQAFVGPERNDTHFSFEQKALELFLRSRNFGNKYAISNVFALLYNGDESMFPDYDYDALLIEAQQAYEKEFGALPTIERAWVLVGTEKYTSSMSPFMTDSEKLVSNGTSRVYSSYYPPIVTTYYNYTRYRKLDNGVFLFEQYCPITNSGTPKPYMVRE